ncbi:helix-turn-helix domain-containing protein [Dyella telluris]|uniref:Helix-turn-helix domain-containing protein n=1 Tax=Dyella telluris TaxID=2763498 RepID=A0A7G8PZJ1_9GAMM|nr:helix-turn-helix domain-containing protein [Dyella telluris]QNJ99948.1 helix-turn-helix domain-containing protein [Dyella telluris]
MKHKENSNTPNVFGDRDACREYTHGVEGDGLSADAVIRRMRQVYAVRSDSALAAALHLAPSAPSNWRQRNRPPFGMCAAIAQSRGVSLDWLVLGIGEMRPAMRRQVRDTPAAPYRASSPVAMRLITFVSLWDAAGSTDELIWLEQHLKRTVSEYEKWLDANAEEAPAAGD